jgi:flagellar hook protein FlgE
MDITIALAASRLVAQQRAMDVTANNIANANTPGYRTERVQFSDWVDNQSGSASAPGVKSISYTQDRATYRESQPGSITHTGNPFDLALTGATAFTHFTHKAPLANQLKYRFSDPVLKSGSSWWNGLGRWAISAMHGVRRSARSYSSG